MADKSIRADLLDWKDALITALAGVISLFLYVRTLVPGLIPNDSSEFQVLAFVMDHAHTTGYQVYTLLAKVFTLLAPVGDIAYRVNLFSAFCASVTVALVYLACRVLSQSRWGGLVGAAVLAICATFWSQAIIAEVYTAGSMFTAAILLMVLLWRQSGKVKFLFAAGLMGGLAIGVHGSNNLFAPAILVLLLLHFRELRKTWKPALAGAALGLALLVGAFMVVDASEGNASIMNAAYYPSISRWDLEQEDVDSPPERFAFLVFARQWRSAMFTDPVRVIPSNLGKFVVTMVRDFSAPVLLLLFVGMVGLFARDWRMGIFFLLAIMVHNIYTFNYSIGDIYVFFIPLYVYFAVLIAEGTAVFLRLAARIPKRSGLAGEVSLPLAFLVLAVAPFALHRWSALQAGELRFDFMQLDSNAKLEEWHHRISYNVENLPDNAVVLMDWNNLYGYIYVAQVEQRRPEMQFMEAYPYATKNQIADSLLVFLRQKLEQGYPVYSMERFEALQRGGFILSSRPVGVNRMSFIELPQD